MLDNTQTQLKQNYHILFDIKMELAEIKLKKRYFFEEKLEKMLFKFYQCLSLEKNIL